MSTDYVLLENSKGTVEVWEHSCKFDVAIIKGKEEPTWESLRDLDLEDLKKLNTQLTNVISYFDPDYCGCKVGY